MAEVDILIPNKKQIVKRIFLNEGEIKIFEENLLTVVDSILTFTSHNLVVKPIITSKDLQSIPSYAVKDLRRQWLQHKTTMHIKDLVTEMLPNQKCKAIAETGIVDIHVNRDEKTVYIKHNFTIAAKDIQTLTNILENMLFDYYDVKVIDALQTAKNNLLLAQNAKHNLGGSKKVFNKVNRPRR